MEYTQLDPSSLKASRLMLDRMSYGGPSAADGFRCPVRPFTRTPGRLRSSYSGRSLTGA